MNRIKISVTVDHTLLKMVDEFIGRHDGADRSKVINEALRKWFARRQEDAMEAQYSMPAEAAPERHAWRTTRRAAGTRFPRVR